MLKEPEITIGVIEAIYATAGVCRNTCSPGCAGNCPEAQKIVSEIIKKSWKVLTVLLWRNGALKDGEVISDWKHFKERFDYWA